MIGIDCSGIESFIGSEFRSLKNAASAYEKMKSMRDTGWMALPESLLETAGEIKAAAASIAADSNVLVVIGIGGSYLGTRAAIELLRSPFFNSLSKTGPDIYFAGNNASGEYLEKLIAIIGGRDFSVNIVSKTGTTIEMCVAQRVFKALLEAKYGKDGAKKRIYVTSEKGSKLHKFALEEKLVFFEIPANCGGRYSVLSAVGMLPTSLAGIDVCEVAEGALDEKSSGLETAMEYASARQALYGAGKKIELLACFEPSFTSFGEWWKQLFGESEGKNGLGIFPAFASYTADLHSLGQYVQEGERSLFETAVVFQRTRAKLRIPRGSFYDDGLDMISGRCVDEVNEAATDAVKRAHISGGVPVIEVSAPEISAAAFGALVYFFETACAVSAVLSGVNPFGQPGVEAYKKNLFSDLGI